MRTRGRENDAGVLQQAHLDMNDIAFTDWAVSSDRQAVADCFKAEAIEDIREVNRERLEIVFLCPYVRSTISILGARLDEELRERGMMDGTSIHQIIDPILMHSPHWQTGDDLSPSS